MDLKIRTIAGLGLFFILGFLWCGCKQSFEGLGVNIKLENKQLSNGMQIILVEDHTIPIITYQSWFRVGSVDERPGITGISHLFEHLMFKGTPKYGPKQFFFQLEEKGAEVNAFTTRDYTTYYESFIPDLLPKVIDMESDRLANLVLNDEILKTERQVVFEERRLRADNSPVGKMQEALWALAFRQHPYRWPVIGFAGDLLNITVEDLEAYFKAHYQPANATLVIVGDFDSASTFEAIKKAYEKIPARPRPTRDIETEEEQNEERRLILYDQVASERFAQAYHVTSALQEDSYALDVLANILFMGTSSRAYRRLVDERDIATAVSGSAFTPSYPGLFIMSGTMKGHLPSSEAERLLDQVLREVQDHGVTAEEVQIAVRQLTVQLVDSVRTPYGLGQVIGTAAMVFGDPERFAKDLNKYLKITPAEVKRVAQVYLIPNNRSVVTLVPDVRRPKLNRQLQRSVGRRGP